MTTSQPSTRSDNDLAIRRIVIGAFGRSATVLSCEPYAYGTTFPLYHARLEIRGEQLDLIVKDSGRAATTSAVPSGKPDFLYHPLREALVYRDILDELPLGTARFHGSAHDEALQHVYLILVRVPGRELWQVGEFSSWQQVAAQLARQHFALSRFLASRPRIDVPWLDHSMQLALVWLERALRFNAHCSSNSVLLNKASQLLSAHGHELFDTEPTIVHGDFYPSNILLREVHDESLIACPIDWEIAGPGPGVLDLASYTSGRWSVASRAALVSSYFEELTRIQGTKLNRLQFERQFALARMQTAIRWLGWSDGWQPPVEHRHDWATELEDSMQQFERLTQSN